MDTVTIEFRTEVNTVTQEKKEELMRLMIMRRCVIKMHFAVMQTECQEISDPPTWTRE